MPICCSVAMLSKPVNLSILDFIPTDQQTSRIGIWYSVELPPTGVIEGINTIFPREIDATTSE